MPRNDGTITIEDVQILYTNFSGKPSPFNKDGSRNFCVLLTEEVAGVLAEDGWNVKATKPRDEGDEPRPYLKVTLGYKYKPSRVTLITSKGRQDLPEDMLDMLDMVDIAKVDLIIRPFEWVMMKGTPQETSGIAAYVKSLWVVLEEDELDLKYADVEYAQRPGQED